MLLLHYKKGAGEPSGQARMRLYINPRGGGYQNFLKKPGYFISSALCSEHQSHICTVTIQQTDLAPAVTTKRMLTFKHVREVVPPSSSSTSWSASCCTHFSHFHFKNETKVQIDSPVLIICSHLRCPVWDKNLPAPNQLKPVWTLCCFFWHCNRF